MSASEWPKACADLQEMRSKRFTPRSSPPLRLMRMVNSKRSLSRILMAHRETQVMSNVSQVRRRNVIAIIAGFLLCTCAGILASRAALGQEANYPSRPITLIIPFPPGSSGDMTFRLLAERFRTSLGQPIVVENRAGAAGNVGFTAGARAAPDGYTLTQISSPIVINPFVFKAQMVDPVRDFAPIRKVATYYLMLTANLSVPANSLADLVKLAKQKPEAVSYATVGGGTTQLTMVLFEKAAGIKFLAVPYKGPSDALQAVLAGSVMVSGMPLTTGYQLTKQGKVKALAYFGPKRATLFPDVPTIAETFPGSVIGGWLALVAPAGTPRSIIDRLGKAIDDAVRDPVIRDRIIQLGNEPEENSSPEQLAQQIKDDLKLFGRLTKEAGMIPQ